MDMNIVKSENPLLALSIALAFFIAVLVQWHIIHSFQYTRSYGERNLAMERMVGEITHSAKSMGRAVRHAAASGDMTWQSRHEGSGSVLEAVLVDVSGMLWGLEVKEVVEEIKVHFNEISRLEYEAFTLVDRGEADRAAALLAGAGYAERRQALEGSVENLRGRWHEQESNRQNAERRQVLALMALVVAAFALLTLSLRFRRHEQEVSEKKEAELADEKRRLESVVSATNTGIWEWDVSTGQVEINEKAAEMCGFSLRELAPFTLEKWESMLHPDDAEDCREAAGDCLAGRLDSLDREWRVRHKNGSLVWVDWRGRVVSRDESGIPLKVAGTVTDMSERKRAEEFSGDRRSRAWKMTTDIVSNLINADEENINAKIGGILQMMGEFLCAERCLCLLFTLDGKYVERVLEWRRDGTASLEDDLEQAPVADLPGWIARAVEEKKEINICEPVDSYPKNSDGENGKNSIGTQSCRSLAVPMIVGKRVPGVMGFSAAENRMHLNADDMEFVRVVTNVLADTWALIETGREYDILREEIIGSAGFEGIVSKNRVMRDIFDIVPDVADSSTTVQIEGESGTGKELLARAIHNHSPRKDKPFIRVNCSALPETLLESELFGYKAGAFTDAKQDKPGRFALAEGGTIFLDEIGDVPASAQVKLLHVLQDGAYEPVGSTESIHGNVRVIAATNKSLSKLVKDGAFREDLFYRINVVRLELPPLRERKEDIPLLTEHFVRKINAREGDEISGVTHDALASLMAYDYPGNVRELENIIERCFVLCKGRNIEGKHLPEHIRSTERSAMLSETDGGETEAPALTLREMELLMIKAALKRNDGNKTASARELGIAKRTLFRKLKSYEIEM